MRKARQPTVDFLAPFAEHTGKSYDKNPVRLKTRETKDLLTTEKKTEELAQTISEEIRDGLKAFGYLN